MDITSDVAKALSGQAVRNGIVILFTPGSTAGVTTIENENGLIHDFQSAMDRLIPETENYRHNRNGEDNGHSHVRASIIGPSITIPFQNKKMLLGTWQQIVLIDFDTRPRHRELVLQFMGEE